MLRILNKESGAWGVSGVSTDFRDIERAAAKGDTRSILALESRAYIIAQYIPYQNLSFFLLLNLTLFLILLLEDLLAMLIFFLSFFTSLISN